MIRMVVVAGVVLFSVQIVRTQGTETLPVSSSLIEQELQSIPDSAEFLSAPRAEESDGVHVRSLVFADKAANHPLTGFDSTEAEDFPAATRPKLLPDNMSFLERGLWGEHGILRGIGIASELTPEVRRHELAVRRTMLSMHQIGGFVTLGLMGTTVYFGQKYLNNGLIADRNTHTTFVLATIISYGTTAMLSVLSPPPLIRRDEISTISIHKTLAWIHFAGMIATPLLGRAISKSGSSYYDRARVHQIAAYITTAVFAASLIVVTF